MPKTLLRLRKSTHYGVQFFPGPMMPDGEPAFLIYDDETIHERLSVEEFAASDYEMVGKTRRAIAKQLTEAGLEVPASLARRLGKNDAHDARDHGTNDEPNSEEQ